MIRKGLGLFLILILFFGLNTGEEAYKGINMRTYTRYSDTTKPASGDVQFIAFYNGDDSTILAYEADKITNFKDPVSWNSLIYKHWDGVKVLISSPANSIITIDTAEGNVEMTAQEFYDLSEAYVEDIGEGNEIVVKVYPIKNPKYFLKVLWGKTSQTDYVIRSEKEVKWKLAI